MADTNAALQSVLADLAVVRESEHALVILRPNRLLSPDAMRSFVESAQRVSDGLLPWRVMVIPADVDVMVVGDAEVRQAVSVELTPKKS